MTTAVLKATRSGAAKDTTARRNRNVMIVASGLGIGGAEMVMRDLTLAIDPGKFNVSVCCLKELGSVGFMLARSGVDIMCLPKRPGNGVDYLTGLKLARVIRSRRINLVHTHTTDGLMDAALCRVLMPRLKVVHTFHFGNYPHLSQRMLWMERVCSRLVNRLVAVGETQSQQLRAAFGLDETRVGVIRNGVSLAPLADASAFRERVRAAGDALVVGTIATLIEQKGLRDLLAVASSFRDAKPSVRFVIVGEGHLRAELEAMRRDLGLEATLTLTGWVPDAARVALPAFDVYFQPSRWEAMSIAVLEAMAAAKAVVATWVGENPRMITDGVDGLLVEPENVGAMVAALRRVLDDQILRRRLGGAARRKVEECFTTEHMVRAYEDLYSGLLG